MKSKKMFFRYTGILIGMFILFSFPVSSLAAENIPTVQIPESVTDTIPDASEICDDPNYSEGTSSSVNPMNSANSRLMTVMSSNTVSGGCSILKLTSTSVQISGYSTATLSDPGLKVTLQLQAYYNGAWHTLASTQKRTSGTQVELTKTYNVTSGYYYRVLATHSLSDGTSSTSRASSIYIG